MVNAVSKETGNESAKTVASKPDSDSCWNLLSGVPHASDVDKGRGDGCLGHAQQEADSDEAAKVCAGCGKRDNGSPKQRVDRYIFPNGKTLNEKCCWVFPEEVSEVEY